MIRIVIAEDQRMMLGALSSLLNLEEDMEVVGRASNGQEALALVQELAPDICLMDIEMPVKSGLEAAEELKGMSQGHYPDHFCPDRIFRTCPKGRCPWLPAQRQSD